MGGRKSQNQNPGIPIWGAATEQRQAPWSTGWLSCSGEKYIDTTFQNIAIHRGQQKDQKKVNGYSLRIFLILFCLSTLSLKERTLILYVIEVLSN